MDHAVRQHEQVSSCESSDVVDTQSHFFNYSCNSKWKEIFLWIFSFLNLLFLNVYARAFWRKRSYAPDGFKVVANSKWRSDKSTLFRVTVKLYFCIVDVVTWVTSIVTLCFTVVIESLKSSAVVWSLQFHYILLPWPTERNMDTLKAIRACHWGMGTTFRRKIEDIQKY